MLHCVHAVKYKLQCKVGYFDLYGFDFMIDEDMKVQSYMLTNYVSYKIFFRYSLFNIRDFCLRN